MNNNLNILNNIKCEFAEQDTRGQFRGDLGGKILFREESQENFDKKINEINTFFSEGNIVIEKETSLPYKILKEKYCEVIIDFTLNNIFTGKKEYFINSKYLESPIGNAKYTAKSYELSKEEFEKINLSDNEKLKIHFLEKLNDISNFSFNQDGYFNEIVNAYRILLGKIEIEKIQITNSDKIAVEDGTHRIIALNQLIYDGKKLSDYGLSNLKNQIKDFLVKATIEESKIMEGHFNFKEMEILNYNEIDEQPTNKRMLSIIKGYKELI
ncbi:MAG: hypothetical protein Q9M94_06485 [Candidatus Gracilibacteria bacterium]|nr:hypothetical protein [Candidatus Gracilibacteria bacterium]MDQ7023769.1 hypothetical protein [Candidatus Gracilibacteria bacterium]